MTRTHTRRQIETHLTSIEDRLQIIIAEELARVWRVTLARLRRINRTMKRTPARKLVKADIVPPGDLWQQFRERMLERMREELATGSVTLAMLQAAKFSAVQDFSTYTLAQNYEAMLAERITKAIASTKRKVARQVMAWYRTPGTPLQTLINNLESEFDIKRAHRIARNEITALNSAVQEGIAARLDIREWWWSTRRDSLVCTKPLVGPDGKIYKGCRALHGKRFRIGDKMPPDGSHINCRCNAILLSPRLVPTPIPEPIINTSHLTERE